MKKALNPKKVKSIYNYSYGYYDLLHTMGTFRMDERGRKHLVEKIVKPEDYILDAGGGTGLTALKAAKRLNENGKIVILDFSEKMLEKANAKAKRLGLSDKIETRLGDMYEIPYPDDTFDSVLSTYSTCPLENPMKAVDEMLRVLKPGGVLGIAHSSDPENKVARWLSSKIENVIWKFPGLSLGCRNIELMTGIQRLDVEILEDKIIGFVPFYFRIILVKKR
ncbi:MAG: class I SAM-dependent methyltransferase [Cyclobacteriaceae bacterium]|nr:class I SAM-dependent methyltransferase [Cyclobacteriaceae bacterium]